jgi:energy-coupling factor transport system ATP-binding protein
MADRIALSSFSFQYSPSTPRVLSSLSLEIAGGTCCAILGPTGAGKTSLLHCLSGIMRRHHPEAMSSGKIQIGKLSFDELPPQILFPTVGLTLQDPHVQISGVRDTVFGEVLFTLENTGTMPQNPSVVILPLLRSLGIDLLADRKPTSLSGGETQRVALATILVAQPPVLLLDEPATALDMTAQEMLRGILRSMKGKTTIVLTDTQLDFALGVCDQIIVLDEGAILFDGTPAAFLRRMQDFATALPLESWNQMEPELVEMLNHPSTRGSRITRALGIT